MEFMPSALDREPAASEPSPAASALEPNAIACEPVASAKGPNAIDLVLLARLPTPVAMASAPLAMAFGFAGATPSMYREWILTANDLMTDKTSEGLKRLSYNFPYLGILGLDDDLRALGRATY